jgi:hypothetical protein
LSTGLRRTLAVTAIGSPVSRARLSLSEAFGRMPREVLKSVLRNLDSCQEIATE